MASMSYSPVAPFPLAWPRWRVSCPVSPPAVSAATMIRLHSFSVVGRTVVAAA